MEGCGGQSPASRVLVPGLGFTVTLVGSIWNRGIGVSQGSIGLSLERSRTERADVLTSFMLQLCLVVALIL